MKSNGDWDPGTGSAYINHDDVHNYVCLLNTRAYIFYILCISITLFAFNDFSGGFCSGLFFFVMQVGIMMRANISQFICI